MSKIGKRIEIDSETVFQNLNGLQGIVLAEHPTGAHMFRVALDNGAVGDFPSIVLAEVESDLTDELTRPPYPAVQTERDQIAASIMAGRVYQVMESNRLEIVEIEAQIKTAQDKIARDIRANYPDLYESQRVTGIVFAQHEARIQDGAEVVWQSKGCPVKGKTYGAAQVATERKLIKFDMAGALAYARTQAANFIQTTVDVDRFTQAVKDGILTNVPEGVCKWEESHTVKTLRKSLAGFAQSDLPESE